MSQSKKDLQEGDVFHELTITVIGEYKSEFICRCGNKTIRYNSEVASGHTKSCGCSQYSPGLRKGLNKKHGMTYSKVYRAWCAMKVRCYKKHGHKYESYGGRGIKVCDRWLESFENFYEDMGDPPTDEYSLDRIDNDGDYEPSNCRWATKTQQSRNTRVTTRILVNGEEVTLRELCDSINVPLTSVRTRMFYSKKKYTIHECFFGKIGEDVLLEMK